MSESSKTVESKRVIVSQDRVGRSVPREPVRSAILAGILFAIFIAGTVVALTYLTDKPDIIVGGALAAGFVLIVIVLIYSFRDLLHFLMYFCICWVDDRGEVSGDFPEKQGRE